MLCYTCVRIARNQVFILGCERGKGPRPSIFVAGIVTRAESASSSAALPANELCELLKSKLGSHIVAAHVELGDAVIEVDRSTAHDLFQLLKLDSAFHFDYLVDITAVDWMDERPERFQVVYHLLSLKHLHRLRVKIDVPETQLTVASVVDLWSGANFMEREVWDMFGIRFENHPDLRRILMYPEFEGYPLRKDYPVQAKQPRIPLRYPEVRNTAVDLERPGLVQIGGAKSAISGSQEER